MSRFGWTLVASFISVVCCPAQEQPERSIQILVSFDYPGALTTIPHGINQDGSVVGEFTDATGIHGFIRFKNGTFSPPITHPDDPAGETFGFDINRSAMVGYYVDLSDLSIHSFLFTDRAFTDLDIAGAASTTVLGLNSAGDYCGSVDGGSGSMQAFVSIAGQLTQFSVAGATFTSANAISDAGWIAGVYQLGDANNHGFIRDSTGNLTYPIEYPGGTSTILRGINSSGWVAGGYIDTQLVQHGMLFRSPNSFFSYTYPGSTFTTFEGTNDRGQICGYFKDKEGQRHGFIGRFR